MGGSLFSNSHFQMGVTIMGFAEHFGLSLVFNKKLRFTPYLMYYMHQIWLELRILVCKEYFYALGANISFLFPKFI